MEVGALDCCSNITGTAQCGSSSGISVSATQTVTIASESSYQYMFNISEAPMDITDMTPLRLLPTLSISSAWGCCASAVPCSFKLLCCCLVELQLAHQAGFHALSGTPGLSNTIRCVLNIVCLLQLSARTQEQQTSAPLKSSTMEATPSTPLL